MEQNQLLKILHAKGIHNKKVLEAMQKIPRDLFVAAQWQEHAYEDVPLPIGYEQTISQPYIVARMTELILPATNHLHKVLEIGTGSGYQACILAELADEVYTIERIRPLANYAKERFTWLGINNIKIFYGDGNQGWFEHAPYDAIIVTAATQIVPPALLQQLAENGRLVIPVGESFRIQTLQLIVHRHSDYLITELDPVRFVPLLSGKED